MTELLLEASLDQALADYLLATEREPDLVPAQFAVRLPAPLRTSFLAELDSLCEVERLAGPVAEGLPAEVAGYRVLGVLGRGAYGIVYEAEQKAVGRRVALKVLAAPASDAEAAARLRREARILAGLCHPSIVGVHDLVADGERCVLVMQLARGRSLRALRSRPREAGLRDATSAGGVLGDVHRIAGIFARIADALAYAHDRGVVHRDLKPANVVVDDHGHPIVLDFGLARTRAGDCALLTGAGDVLGTPLYMAPEQLVGAAAGPAADVWALGCMLHECLTGQAAAGPEPGAKHAVPAALRSLIAACRAQDPAARPTAHEVRATLLAFAARGNRAWVRTRVRRTSGCLLAAGLLAGLAAVLLGAVPSGPRPGSSPAAVVGSDLVQRVERMEAILKKELAPAAGALLSHGWLAAAE